MATQKKGGLNYGQLNDFQKDLNKRTEFDKNLIYGKDISEATDVRLLPPADPENAGGVYFLEVTQHFINKKPYISPKTFGGACPIQEEIELAKAHAEQTGERELLDIVEGKTQFYRESTTFWLPLLLLNCEFDSQNQPTSITVVDDKAKVLVAPMTLFRAINAVVAGRPGVIPGTQWGVMDQAQGKNIILSRTGSGIDTKYGAQLWPNSTSMADKYYAEKAIPNVSDLVSKMLMPDDYLRGVIRNLLWMEQMPEKPVRERGEAPQAGARTAPATPARATAPTRTAPAAAPQRTAPAASPQRTAAPPSRGAAPAPGAGRPVRTRSIADDLDNAGAPGEPQDN